MPVGRKPNGGKASKWGRGDQTLRTHTKNIGKLLTIHWCVKQMGIKLSLRFFLNYWVCGVRKEASIKLWSFLPFIQISLSRCLDVCSSVEDEKKMFSYLIAHICFFMLNTPRQASQTAFSNFSKNVMWMPQRAFSSLWFSRIFSDDEVITAVIF